MKRAREVPSNGVQDDAFDDGEDLMARAADMMDFDNDEDSGSSDDGEDGISEVDAEEAPPAKKKQRGNGKNKEIKVERDIMQEDEEVTSVVQLQIDALLSSVRCPSRTSSKARPLVALLDRLEILLKAIPERKAQPASDAVKSLDEPLPFTGSTDLAAVNWQLAFSPPTAMQVGGSWPTGTSCKWKGKTGWNVDLLVSMPPQIFQEKDVKDSRYFYKRAYFLATLKKAIARSDVPVDARYAYLHHDRRKAILELSPKSGGELDFSSLRCLVRVIPTLDMASSPLVQNRLYPSRNNIRFQDKLSGTEPPTPMYNSAIASDTASIPTLAYLQRISDSTPAFCQAALLLKIWIKQRGLERTYGLERATLIVTLLLAYLVGGGNRHLPRLPPMSSAWQLFKGCLDFLGKRDFINAPVIAYTPMRDGKAPSDDEWSTLGLPVMTDPTGLANLFAETPTASLELIRYDAQLSMKHIRENEQTAFAKCLLTPMDKPHLRFDHTARVHLCNTGKVSSTTAAESSSPEHAIISTAARVLRQALGNRIKVLSIRPTFSQAKTPGFIDIGLVMEPSQLARVVEYGPAADKPEEVREFGAFWGSKSETRRFKDGRILESVVWEADGPAERVRIFEQVIRQILAHHLGIQPSSMHFFAKAYDSLLVETPQIRKALYTADPQETGFGPAIAAFDYLVKELKALKNLPLTINSVTPTSEGMRYTATFVPGAIRTTSLPSLSTSANFVPVHECLLTFEGSGKWPEDLEAIQKVKAAFLAKMAEELRQAVPGNRCDLSIDLSNLSEGDGVALDILLPQGFAFRLRVHHSRERSILEDSLLDDDLEEELRRTRQGLLVAHHKRFTAGPAHHAAIASLQHRHTSYSTTVRITKRWLASHLLLPYVPVQVVELICASVYLDSEAVFETPASGVAGFARTLSFLANWNWREVPLLVPIFTAPSHDFTQGLPTFPNGKRQKALNLFSQARKQDPAMNKIAWFVVTEQDQAGHMWIQGTPSKLIAARVQELARACLQSLSEQAVAGDAEVKHLFTPSTEGFDFILHLDPAKVSRHRQALYPDGKALAKRPTTSQPVRPGFDAVQAFCDRATATAGDAAILLHDPNGGLSICGLFNPSVAAKGREFRIALDFATKPTNEKPNGESKTKVQVTMDKASFLRQLVDMGDGLVARVSTREVL